MFPLTNLAHKELIKTTLRCSRIWEVTNLRFTVIDSMQVSEDRVSGSACVALTVTSVWESKVAALTSTEVGSIVTV